MDNLKYLKDFIKEEFSQNFWDKERGKIETNLLDAINDVKKYFTIGGDKYKKSLENAVDVFKKSSDYSKKHDDIMKEAIHDYLEDFISALKFGDLEKKSLENLNYLMDEYDVNSMQVIKENYFSKLDNTIKKIEKNFKLENLKKDIKFEDSEGYGNQQNVKYTYSDSNSNINLIVGYQDESPNYYLYLNGVNYTEKIRQREIISIYHNFMKLYNSTV
jgi:hypothetical protein